jgi:hypothetical protein
VLESSNRCCDWSDSDLAVPGRRAERAALCVSGSQQKAWTMPGFIENHSARIKLPHLLRAFERGSALSPLNPAPEGVYWVKKGCKYANQHDDEE